MNSLFKCDLDKVPYLIVNNGKVIEISQSFVDFTGFSKEELIFKGISEIFRILKIISKSSSENIKDEEYFMFTKSLEVRFINIYSEMYSDNEVYYFTEALNSRIDGKFPSIEAMYAGDVTGVAIFRMPEGILLKANNKYVSFFNKPYNVIENCVGKPVFELLPDYNIECINKIWNTIISTGESYYLEEYKYEGLKCGAVYFNSTITPVFEGKVIKYCIQIINDVTDKVLNRKKVFEQTKIIEQQKKQFEAVFENMADGCIFFDKNKKVISINKTAKSWLPGIKIEQMNDFLNSILWCDLDGRPIDYKDLPSTRIISGEQLNQVEVMMEKGDTEKVLSISGTPIYDENGNFNIGVLNASDITEQTKYKKALKLQNEYLYRMIDVLNLPIIRLSYPELNIIGVNIKGYDFIIGTAKKDIKSPGSIIGGKIYELYSSTNFGPFKMCIDSMVRDCNPVYMKDINIIINNEKSYFNFIFQPISVIDMKIQEFMIICIDITDEIVQKQAVEEVMKMQQEFFTYITHEFKTPLTSMCSIIQVLELLHSNEMNENLKKNISRLKRNTLQQLRLVNNLLDIIKAESGYLKVYKSNYDIVQLTKVIVESIYEFASAKNIKINFNFLVKSKLIAVDDEKYERIILNLLSNAIKYTPSGKSITITVSADKKMVYVAVEDEGVGIPKDKYDTLFKRFGQVGSSLTRCSEGTGIGLCLAKLLTRAMDGDITFTSQEGKGTTFTVSLPDIKVNEKEASKLPQLTEGRLIRTMNVEFSTIYLE